MPGPIHALALLLFGSDAVPAAVLAGWLRAAEAAYTHVEADCRFSTSANLSPGPAGRPDSATDETYVGSWGRGHALFTGRANFNAISPFQSQAWLVNPAYSATAAKTPTGGWVLAGIQPPTPVATMHPHAPCGLPGDTVGYCGLLAQRTGRVSLTPATRDGKPVWTAIVPLAPPDGARVGLRRLTLTLTASLPVLVLDACIDRPGHADEPARWCQIGYAPAAAGDWPAVAVVRAFSGYRHWVYPVAGEQRAEFARYVRLAAPPADDRFTLAAVGLPPPDPLPTRPTVFASPPEPSADADSPADEPAGGWQWWAIGGILLVGAVAFVRAGRTREG